VNLYALAEKLGKTAEELLYGEPRPMTGKILARWIAYLKLRNTPRDR